MSKVEIFYFSGTGNSLVVARDLADKLNGIPIAIISVIDQPDINTDADTIGIVFPIYDFKAPRIVNDFLDRLQGLDSKYLFAVATYGVAPLKAMKKLARDIKNRGGNLDAGFVVEMPHNALGYTTPVKEQQKLFENWNMKVDAIASQVERKQSGHIKTTGIVTFVLSRRSFEALPSLLAMLWQVMRHGVESMRFCTDEKCSGCGTCARVCPMQNIGIVAGKPSWSDNCLSCFACLNWCPQEAIQAGKLTVGMKRYHHPDVEASELFCKPGN